MESSNLYQNQNYPWVKFGWDIYHAEEGPGGHRCVVAVEQRIGEKDLETDYFSRVSNVMKEY